MSIKFNSNSKYTSNKFYLNSESKSMSAPRALTKCTCACKQIIVNAFK